MTRLVIVGAGGFGREVQSWVRTSPRWAAESDIEEVVFIDDNVPAVAVGAPIVSSIGDYFPDLGDLVVCAIGAPEVRRLVVAKLAGRGAHFATFVHDRAILGSAIELSPGVIICPNALLSSDIRVGDHTHINAACTIGHDVVIGEFVTMSAACNLTGGVVVESGAFLATATTVIPGKKIGAGAYVGAGSIVLKDVPPHTTVFGNPSKIVGKRTL